MADLARRVLESDPEESRRALRHAVVRAVHDEALDGDVGGVGHKNRRSEWRAVEQTRRVLLHRAGHQRRAAVCINGQGFVDRHLLRVGPFANANRCARSRRIYGVLNPAECCIRTFHFVIVHDELWFVSTDQRKGQKQDQQQGRSAKKSKWESNFHRGLPSETTLREIPRNVGRHSLRPQGLRLEVRLPANVPTPIGTCNSTSLPARQCPRVSSSRQSWMEN